MSKEDKPRNCFSSEFKKNFDEINWKKPAKKYDKFRAIATTDQDDTENGTFNTTDRSKH